MNAIARNTGYLKELEAQLNTISAFGGLQNSKAVKQAELDAEKADERSRVAIEESKVAV